MASFYTITVDAQPSVDEVINVQAEVGGTTIDMSLTFKIARSAVGECAIGSTLFQTAENIKNALIADYNNTLLFRIIRFEDEVRVTAFNATMTFTLDTNTADPDVVVAITNDAIENFTIDNITFSQADSNACDNVKLSIECNNQADTINTPISAPVASNPYIVTLSRSNAIQTVTMQRNTATDAKTFLCPKLLSTYFEVSTNTNYLGDGEATIQVQAGVFSSGLAFFNPISLEFSLNNADWQASNIFSNLDQGDYTVYIRDGLGCTVTLDFSITEFDANFVDYGPMAEISLTNSLTFKTNEVINGCSIFSNVDNALSFNERSNYNHRNYKDLFQQCDPVIRTQIKSNYDTITAKLVDCQGTETPLTVTKVTDNMGKVDVRDAGVAFVAPGSFQVKIYFIAGNTYDPDTLVVNGTYNTAGAPPSFYNVGDYVFLEGYGWTEIIGSEVVDEFTEFLGYPVTMLTTSAVVPEGLYSVFTPIKVTAMYNVVNYERYEIGIDPSALEGDYYVCVDFTDVNFDAVQKISEWIHIAEEIDDRHHVIEWYHSENNDINYATGIQFRMRAKNINMLEFSPDLNQDIYVTDTQTILGENVGREFFALNLFPVPTNIARRLARALYHNRLKIDGLTYLLNGVPEIKKLGNTNLYTVKATLVKSDYIFKNNRSISLEEIILPSGDPLNIDGNSQGLLIVN